MQYYASLRDTMICGRHREIIIRQNMERLRKENDFDILWEIVAGGKDSNIPYDLTGKNLKVFMINAYERVAVKNFKVEGNTISWRYLGKDQQRRGIYSLLLIENEGEEGMHTVDECQAFELVDCSCMEGGEAESHVRIETIRLKSGISVNSIVPDKKLDVDSGNVVENAAIAKEFQRVDNDIKRVSDTVENQDREIVNLGETLSEHGDALDVLNGEGEGSVKRTVADEVARIVADAPEGYDTLKEIADYITSDKTGAAQINDTLDAHGKAISAIEKKNTEQDTAIGKKAEQDGVYPDMTVGLAEDLGGRPYYDDAEFSFRASAGSDTSIKDGMASIKELRGNSVVWNQELPIIIGDKWYCDPVVASTTIADDKVILTVVGQQSELPANGVGLTEVSGKIKALSGHKYYIQAEIKPSVAAKVGIRNYTATWPGYYEMDANANVWNKVAYIDSPTSDRQTATYVGTTLSNILSNGDTIEIRNVAAIDLTLMFGAGNEPVTIDEFYARMPIGVDMSAYNEGEVIHMAADGIKSVGDNAWDEEWEQGAILDNGQLDPAVTYMRSKNYTRVIQGEQYYALKPAGVLLILALYDINKNFIRTADLFSTAGSGGLFTIPSGVYYIKLSAYTYPYNNDIMISLVHSGWKQDTDAGYQPYWEDRLIFDQRIKEHFPDGMKKWDMVYNKNGKGYIVKGTGVVDMGELVWNTGFDGVATNSLMKSIKMPTTGNEDTVLCSLFAVSPEALKVVFGGADYPYNGYIAVVGYSDVDSFKEIVSGTPLYYQLAEPTIIEYDEPFNLDYKVADFGTEEVISDQPSAPIAAEIQYNFNANDTIRTNRIAIRDMHREIAELRAMISAMQVQLTNKEDEA